MTELTGFDYLYAVSNGVIRDTSFACLGTQLRIGMKKEPERFGPFVRDDLTKYPGAAGETVLGAICAMADDPDNALFLLDGSGGTSVSNVRSLYLSQKGPIMKRFLEEGKDLLKILRDI